MAPESNDVPSSAVTVWVEMPVFVQVTVAPAVTVIGRGAKVQVVGSDWPRLSFGSTIWAGNAARAAACAVAVGAGVAEAVAGRTVMALAAAVAVPAGAAVVAAGEAAAATVAGWGCTVAAALVGACGPFEPQPATSAAIPSTAPPSHARQRRRH